MSARDDYPYRPFEVGDFVRWENMCDEIDRLRGENKDLRSQADAWADSAADANRSAVKAWVRVHIAEQKLKDTYPGNGATEYTMPVRVQ